MRSGSGTAKDMAAARPYPVATRPGTTHDPAQPSTGPEAAVASM